MELSRAIKRLRTEKGWSQEMLAERSYVSRQTVSNWENEKSVPDIHSLLLLSDIFGVSLDELIKGDVEKMKDTVRNEDAAMLKRIEWLSVLEWLALFGCTVLVEQGGEVGKILGSLLIGILVACVFMTYHKLEQIKQDNDIQTYREYLAFINGKTLDEIEKEKELKKRDSQKKLLIFTVATSGAILAAAAVSVILQLR
ncbi:MAG: helix-turn-helix transcriptional regulator [Ruminococcus sp.]|nr:helix-turn-helix transcriptional regulator [Ruminococcus sp.]